MKFTATTMALAVGQAAAWSWTDAPSYSCPSSSSNQCNSQQSSGFDWESLGTGGFSSYGNFGFSGWSCSNSFSKRGLQERDFQDKCITGSLSQGSGPSFSCGSESNGFSIDTYQITVDQEVDVEFVYQMESGETCSHTNTCSPEGTTVQNTQCGGAKQVSFQLPSGSKSSSCSIGVHSIGFYCSSSSSTPVPTSSPVKSSSVPVVYSTPSSKPVSSPVVYSSSAPVSSPVIYSSPSSSPAPVSSPVVYSSSAPVSSPIVYSSSSPAGPAPSSPCPNVLPQCLNTWLSSTSCKDNTDCGCFCEIDDFTENIIECVTAWGASTEEISAALSYLVGICAPYVPGHPGIVTNCPSTIPLGPTGSSSAPAPVETTSTTVIISTTVTTCPAGQTITHASGTTVLAKPSTSTIYLTTTSTICTKCTEQPTAPVTTAPTTPYTTITITTSITVPCSYTTGSSSGQPIPSSSTVVPYSTCVTVPQVSFTTSSGGSSASVGIAPATTPVAPVQASSTPAAGVATTTMATSYGSTPKVTGGSTPAKNGTVSGTGSPAKVTANSGVRTAGSVISLFVAAAVAAFAL